MHEPPTASGVGAARFFRSREACSSELGPVPTKLTARRGQLFCRRPLKIAWATAWPFLRARRSNPPAATVAYAQSALRWVHDQFGGHS
jgi:hypothetical protein